MTIAVMLTILYVQYLKTSPLCNLKSKINLSYYTLCAEKYDKLDNNKLLDILMIQHVKIFS